jgi:N-acetylmuramoyl-L-alanine amidase
VKAPSWRTLAAPAAFLLAVTIAVALARPALRNESTGAESKPVPATGTAGLPRAPKPAATRVYTVRAGDTLASIASRNGVTVEKLLALNPRVQPTALFIGQRIRLP